MNKETVGTQTIYTKKNPVRKKKMPFACPEGELRQKKKVYYEPLYGTPQCTYEGNKRGRKSLEERQCPTLIKKEKKTTILYFD